MPTKTIILASHGTPGARAAEEAALKAANIENASITHLFVVPDFWADMRGDDWLNNAITQNTFSDYLTSELAREAAEEINRLKEKANTMGVIFQTRAMTGKPADCLISLAEEESPDMIFIGVPRSKGEEGYNSRMKLDPLVRALKTQLIIVPRSQS